MNKHYQYTCEDGDTHYEWTATLNDNKEASYLSVNIEDYAQPYDHRDDYFIYSNIQRADAVNLAAFLIKSLNITESELLIANIE